MLASSLRLQEASIEIDPTTVRIEPFSGLAYSPNLLQALDAIFFEASATQTFRDPAHMRAFQERWLGCYLTHCPEFMWVALGPGAQVLGYVVGSHQDPARDPLFSAIPYTVAFASVTVRYPAHLHINLAPTARRLGLGQRLVTAFIARCAADGIPGVHVVTSAGSRNRSFYDRLRFDLQATTQWNGHDIVCLARTISGAK